MSQNNSAKTSMSQRNNTTAFPFIPPTPDASRSPCPALNTLANHGYIARDGYGIPFWALLNAVKFVYNLSFPLAFLLTVVGYLTCGTLSLYPPLLSTRKAECQYPISYILATLFNLVPNPTWILDLSSLCTHGPFKIAHDASLVHKEDLHATRPSPDPTLLEQLLATQNPASESHIDIKSSESNVDSGLTLRDLSLLHASRKAALRPPQSLSWFHERIALGECGLSWCVMQCRRPRRWYEGNLVKQQQEEGENDEGAVIPLEAVREWFGEERLPDGWWDKDGSKRRRSLRPLRKVGLREAAKKAREVGAIFNVPRRPLLSHVFR